MKMFKLKKIIMEEIDNANSFMELYTLLQYYSKQSMIYHKRIHNK